MVNKYYVYALIDPKTNQIFYIGKGSGSRYKSHAKATLKSGSNIAKYLKIHEIQNEGLEVKTEILYPYLSEEDALLLEKIMIYMLGREALGEGSLLNVVPGGKWKPGDSIFYDEDFTPNFDDSCLDFVARERFLSFTAVADFSYLGAPVKKQKIYVYDFNGKLISADSLSCWFKELSSKLFEVFQALRLEEYPIADSEYIYSKFPISDLYCSENLPLPYLHFIDSEFCRKFDLFLLDGGDFEFDFIINGVIRMEASKKGDDVCFQSYYKSGKKKYFRMVNSCTKYKVFQEWDETGLPLKDERFAQGVMGDSQTFHYNGKIKTSDLYGADNQLAESNTYYVNGNLKERVIFRNGSRIKSRSVYYDNGRINFRYDNFDKPIKYELWDSEGRVIEVYDCDRGYVNYNSDGSLKGTFKERQSKFVDSYNILSPHLYSNSKSVLDMELEKKERKKADEDWARIKGLKIRDDMD